MLRIFYESVAAQALLYAAACRGRLARPVMLLGESWNLSGVWEEDAVQGAWHLPSHSTTLHSFFVFMFISYLIGTIVTPAFSPWGSIVLLSLWLTTVRMLTCFGKMVNSVSGKHLWLSLCLLVCSFWLCDCCLVFFFCLFTSTYRTYCVFIQ